MDSVWGVTLDCTESGVGRGARVRAEARAQAEVAVGMSKRTWICKCTASSYNQQSYHRVLCKNV